MKEFPVEKKNPRKIHKKCISSEFFFFTEFVGKSPCNNWISRSVTRREAYCNGLPLPLIGLWVLSRGLASVTNADLKVTAHLSGCATFKRVMI